MKKASVFYIDSFSDLEQIASLINQKHRNKKPCVLVRYAADETLAKVNLRDMAIRLGILPKITDIVIANEKSLKEKLAEKNYACQYYYGINNHIFDKPLSERDVKPSDKTITFRHACVCNKCESVISEIVKQVSMPKMRQLETQYKDEESVELVKTSSSLSVLDTSSKCMVC